MTLTPERLAAYADGELAGAEAREVEAQIAGDPALQAKLAAHRALKGRLSAHFAPVAAAPVPDRLADLLKGEAPFIGEAEVIDFAAEARKRRIEQAPPPRRRWSRVVGPAIAATLVLGLVGVNMRDSSRTDYAEGRVGAALDGQMVATQKADAPVRLLVSFRDGAGRFCRGFSSTVRSGIACHDERGWRLVRQFGGSRADLAEYRQAGSRDGAILAAIEEMAASPALDAAEEKAAAQRGWQGSAPPK